MTWQFSFSFAPCWQHEMKRLLDVIECYRLIPLRITRTTQHVSFFSHEYTTLMKWIGMCICRGGWNSFASKCEPTNVPWHRKSRVLQDYSRSRRPFQITLFVPWSWWESLIVNHGRKHILFSSSTVSAAGLTPLYVRHLQVQWWPS